MMTREMVELSAAVGERAAAAAEIESARAALALRVRAPIVVAVRLSASRARMRRSRRPPASSASSHTSELARLEQALARPRTRGPVRCAATLSDTDEASSSRRRHRETMPSPAPDAPPSSAVEAPSDTEPTWTTGESEYAPGDDVPIGVALTASGEAVAAAFADPRSSQIPPALDVIEAGPAGDETNRRRG
jgi:hypothetical protein